MAINPDYAGRVFEPSGPYEVSRVKIAEFADAIGEPSPACRDRAAAQAAGYPDVIAPPTFAVVVTSAASSNMMADPGLGVNYAMIVHGEQSFAHTRPLHAGDVVVAQTTISSIRPIRDMTTLTTVTEVRTTGGEPVCTVRSTVVERGAQGGSDGQPRLRRYPGRRRDRAAAVPGDPARAGEVRGRVR